MNEWRPEGKEERNAGKTLSLVDVQGDREGGTDRPTEPGSVVLKVPPPSAPRPGSPPPAAWESHHRPDQPN